MARAKTNTKGNQKTKPKKKRIIAGHLDNKHGYYYMVLSLPNPEKGNRKLPKWFPTGIPYDGSRRNERDAERMLKEWREDFTSGKLTLAIIEEKKAAEKSGALSTLKKMPLRKDMYFTDYLLRWLEIIEQDVERDTFSGYWHIVHNPVLPYFQERNIRLDELSAVDISLFYKSCKKRSGYKGRPISGNTILHYHTTLHKALQDAVVLFRLLDYNPADYVVKPKKDNYVAEYADTEELQALMRELLDSPIRVPVMLGAFYGMRRSEALGIRKMAIDRKKKTITVSHTVVEVSVKGQHEIIRKDRTKNKKSFRTYPLIPAFEQFLDMEMERQAQERALLGSCYYMGDQEYICLDVTGHLLKPNYVTNKFSELVKKHGLKQITFHGLRHSCASMLYEQGLDMKKIQAWLGHSTPVTTATIYAHLDIRHKDVTAEIANRCLQLDLTPERQKELLA